MCLIGWKLEEVSGAVLRWLKIAVRGSKLRLLSRPQPSPVAMFPHSNIKHTAQKRSCLARLGRSSSGQQWNIKNQKPRTKNGPQARQLSLLPLINLGAAIGYQSLLTLFLVSPKNRPCLVLSGRQWTRNVTIQNFSMVTIQAVDWIRMGAEIWSRESKSNAIDGIF